MFEKSRRVPPFTFFDTMRLFQILKFSILNFFRKKVYCLQKMFVSLQCFRHFASNWIFKKPEAPNLYNFRHCEIFPISLRKFSQVFSIFFLQLLVLREVLLSPVEEKLFSSLMRIPWGKRHCKIDEFVTKVYFCLCKKT